MSIQEALLNWDKKSVNFPYGSSILVVNKDVPFFEEKYGQLDFDWLVRCTKGRKCVEVLSKTIRYISGENLSLDDTYRMRDYEAASIIVSEVGLRRLNGTMGRYFYNKKNFKECRKYFLKSEKTKKTVLYYLTSFVPGLRGFIINQFRVFG